MATGDEPSLGGQQQDNSPWLSNRITFLHFLRANWKQIANTLIDIGVDDRLSVVDGPTYYSDHNTDYQDMYEAHARYLMPPNEED
jgi:hypothetical protein